jgi:hypothetical protein
VDDKRGQPATIANPVPETTLIGGGRPRHEARGKILSPTPGSLRLA